MIVYFDTSALVRLYIQEEYHVEVLELVEHATKLASNLIAYAELRAALAKMVRTSRLRERDRIKCVEQFEEDWNGVLPLRPSIPMIRQAAVLAERFGLRGYDSVHLAAAEQLFHVVEDAEFGFACFDSRLNRAAETLGMRAVFG